MPRFEGRRDRLPTGRILSKLFHRERNIAALQLHDASKIEIAGGLARFDSGILIIQ